ncbi:cytochrome P450 [Amycolatopsis nigrescens]|uniref:cytochrome P450 n=1 Tax=Amycolatopsis nigrescens TaxID=381445 RepID=UPI0003790EF2|nr:cytochrome P450 [Amycolatopsis nigrescens]
MTKSVPDAVSLPTQRPPGCPFDPPAELARLREERPLSRMVYPDGHVGWLATSRSLARAVLADSRFSARLDRMHNPFPGYGDAEFPPPQPGDFTNLDAPEHTRYRSLLTGQFTVRRMRQLTERIEQITTEHLDAMERHGPSVDLVQAFTLPIPSLVICELLGVPYSERGRFQEHAIVMTSSIASMEEMATAYTALYEFLRELVLAKRANPTDDLLSGLLTSDLTDEELTNIGIVLLGAGVDTTSNMLALGTFALLRDPEQFTVLRNSPDIADQAVEEMLRYLSIVPSTVRGALEDVELGDQLVKAGETVTISIEAANRDPETFTDPDRLDLNRTAGGQVAFGHGIHQCLGQQLARVEMRTAFPALVKRFPNLRLAVPAEQVRLRENVVITGLHSLPVTWDAA